MKTREAISIIDLVKNSSFYELFFSSLIILPIYLGSWSFILKQFDSSLWGKETQLLISLIILYIVSLLILKFFQSKDHKLEIGMIKIRTYILSKNWQRMSFERIQKNIDSSYDMEFLKELLNKYPSEFRKGTIKGGKKALVIIEQEELEN